MRASVLVIVTTFAAACGGSSFSASSGDAGADATTEAAPSGDSAVTADASDAFVQGDGGADVSALDAPEEKPTSDASEAGTVDAPEEGPALCCKGTGSCVAIESPCGTQSASMMVCCSTAQCGYPVEAGKCVICAPGGTCCPTGAVETCP